MLPHDLRPREGVRGGGAGARLTKHVTPRALRGTFNDLARAAQVQDIVTRSISGHLTDAMQRHDSTVSGDEQRQVLAKVVDLTRAHADRQTRRAGGQQKK